MIKFLYKIYNKIIFLVNPHYPRYLRKVTYYLYRKLIIHAGFAEGLQIPLPQIGKNFNNPYTSGKGKTSFEKWNLISKNLSEDCKTAVDIGSFHGFFSLKLGESGIKTIGYEPLEDLFRLSVEASITSKINNVSFFNKGIDQSNIDELETSDVYLVMSVLQRWDEIYGNKVANEMLNKIWEKTNKYLFFEYPNPVSSTKMSKILSYLGSSEDECEENIKKMLQNLKNSEVKLLGYLPTDFRPEEKRHLFLIKKNTSN